MAQAAALLILPTGQHNGEKMDAAGGAVPLLIQSLEDLRLAERVERALRETGQGPLRGIAVTVRERHVILEGRVPTYYLKQVAQVTASSAGIIKAGRAETAGRGYSRGHVQAFQFRFTTKAG